jgi:hypothetical protein
MTLPTVASSEREGRGAESRSSRVLAFIGIFLLWWILTALVYRHTQSNFLRAESGWYLFLSHSSPVIQHNTERDFWTTSFNGHYAPLAFLAEYETAKLAGTHGSFWKWRQITVLALLATILFLFVRNSGCALQLSRLRASLSATGLTAILIFQAQMREFIAWPFMILQLFWLLFTMISLLALVQMARHRPKLFGRGSRRELRMPHFIFSVWASRPWQPPPQRWLGFGLALDTKPSRTPRSSRFHS